jgi:Putative auto-transporter adhesin, head GIN domain
MKPVRTLVFIALGSALLSAGCLGGAYTLANVNDSGSTELVTREIPWDGSVKASLGLPAVMRYVQAPGPGRIIARGPHRSVSTLKVTGGTIHDTLMRTGAVLEITLTAPSVTSFHLNGRSRLTIEGYDQDSLTLHTQGAAAIDASGSARNIRVFMEGDGDINLARLGADAIDGDLDGFGALVAAPAQRANLNVSGMASVILLTRPPDLKTHLEDAGRVIDASPAN